MPDERWTAVDEYLERAVMPRDPILDEVLAANAAAGLPAIDVSPLHGRLLHILAASVGATRVLEIGTLGGYSTIELARAVGPGGHVTTLEVSQAHADVAASNLRNAGVTHLVTIRVGAALDTLASLAADGAAPFDFVFIDADKINNPHYFDFALRLSRVGTLIVTDNVVRNGAVADEDSNDVSVQATRALFHRMASEPRVVATAIQTVGRKGYDGFAVARVVS